MTNNNKLTKKLESLRTQVKDMEKIIAKERKQLDESKDKENSNSK